MSTLTHDDPRVAPVTRSGAGLGLAVISAASFGLSGSLASALMTAGWSAAAAVTVRISIAAVVLVVPGALAMRGRWRLVRRRAGVIAAYGVIAVAGCQLAYFNAVRHLDVGIALLVEYTAPVAVVGWMWARHGQRPGPVTAVGAVIAAIGLVLVLDLVGGVHPSLIGLAWAVAAMVGAAVYFVLAAASDDALPPLSLAAGGLIVGAVLLLVAGATHVVAMHASTGPVVYRGHAAPFWLPLLALGVITAALAYATGIATVRRLGSRLASFVALLEVVFAVLFAWLLLGQAPRAIQLIGVVVVLAGVAVVKLGEPRSTEAISVGPGG